MIQDFEEICKIKKGRSKVTALNFCCADTILINLTSSFSFVVNFSFQHLPKHFRLRDASNKQSLNQKKKQIMTESCNFNIFY